MHCNYCEATNLRESRQYNIENVRERFNPTYLHTQIFNTTQPLPSKVRCTPTYHSQAFRVDGYGHNCKGKCIKKSEAVQKNSNVFVDVKRTNKSGDFANSRGNSCYNGRVKWYDQQKNEKFNHIQSTYDYSRERKYADLASSSVFDGYVYQPIYTQNDLCNCVNCINCQCGKDRNTDLQCCRIPVQKRSQGCQCQVCNCVNCQCGVTKQIHRECADSPKKKQVVQVPKQSCPLAGCQCVNCQRVNCQCGKKTEVKTCKCINCQCTNCNCESGCCQKVLPQNKTVVQQAKPVVTFNDKPAIQQVTFGKKVASKTQKGLSQPKKVIKEKPTFTVIRQKR